MSTPKPAGKKKWSLKTLGLNFLVVSILAHVLFLSGATYFIVQRIQAKRKLTFQAGPPSPNPATQTVEHKVQMHKETTMSAPQMAKRITTTGLGKINLPEMPEMPTQPDDVKPMKMTVANQMGMNGFGGLGGGGGGLGGGITLPSIMADRCSTEGRQKSINENSGDPNTDSSVVKSLNWLKQNQNDDGTWGTGNKAAMTGLALLSFLGHCEKPSSGQFGPTIKKGIDVLVSGGNSNANGSLAFNNKNQFWPYEHGIACYALGEAYILTHDDNITPAFTKAIGIILEGQKSNGGWAYSYDKEGKDDTSVTCWQIQALKTAHYSGLNIKGVDDALDKAMNFLLHMQGGNGVFGYNKPGEGGELTGAGTFCLLAWHHGKDRAVHDGLRVIRDGAMPKRGDKKKAPPDYQYSGPDSNLYAWYYDAQACFQAGGGAWDWWNQHVMRQIVQLQTPDGTWPPPGCKKMGFNGLQQQTDVTGQVYRTCLCTLTLEVYYRYLSSSQSEGSVQ